MDLIVLLIERERPVLGLPRPKTHTLPASMGRLPLFLAALLWLLRPHFTWQPQTRSTALRVSFVFERK